MNSQAAYESPTQELRDYIDKLIVTINSRYAARQLPRYTHNLNLPSQASGLPSRPLADKREDPRAK